MLIGGGETFFRSIGNILFSIRMDDIFLKFDNYQKKDSTTLAIIQPVDFGYDKVKHTQLQ